MGSNPTGHVGRRETVSLFYAPGDRLPFFVLRRRVSLAVETSTIFPEKRQESFSVRGSHRWTTSSACHGPRRFHRVLAFSAHGEPPRAATTGGTGGSEPSARYPPHGPCRRCRRGAGAEADVDKGRACGQRAQDRAREPRDGSAEAMTPDLLVETSGGGASSRAATALHPRQGSPSSGSGQAARPATQYRPSSGRNIRATSTAGTGSATGRRPGAPALRGRACARPRCSSVARQRLRPGVR